MDPELLRLLSVIITTLLGGGLLLAYVAFRNQKKQEPIDEETAAVINARTAGELALAVAKQQEASIAVLREDLRIVRADLDSMRGDLTALRLTFSTVVTWLRDLFDRWDEHRLKDNPPGGLPPGVI